MLSIFAIDPAICRSPEWFRYCVEHCQTSRGRGIADLPPGEWCRDALGEINAAVAEQGLGPVKGQGLKRRLDLARDRLVHRPGTTWNYLEENWRKNAEAEHRRDLFAAVISPDYSPSNQSERQFHPNDLNESVGEWNTPSGQDITRTHGDFITAIMPMLKVADEIHFLDRGFKVEDNSLYTRNYQTIFRSLASRPDGYPTITIHCCPDEELSDSFVNYFETQLRSHYANLIPVRGKLMCLLWKVDAGGVPRGAHPFHNRFILTEHCGVMIGYGTDSANAATDAPDNLQVIDSTVYRTRFTNSRKRTHPLINMRKEIIIVGTKA